MELKYINSLNEVYELNANNGDHIEIIIKSALYCKLDEKPIYHTGTILDLIFDNEREPRYLIGMCVSFDETYDSKQEETIYFSEIEYVILKEYDILAFAELNVGMTLSIKGNGTGMIIRFDLINGSLIPKTIEYTGESERLVNDKDKELIREISKYGAAQTFSHHLLSKSIIPG